MLVVGEGDAEELWEGGTLRFVLLVLEAEASVSVFSSVLDVSEDLVFLRDVFIAVSLATFSLMWDGTRTQANVRSCVTQPPRISQARMSM